MVPPIGRDFLALSFGGVVLVYYGYCTFHLRRALWRSIRILFR